MKLKVGLLGGGSWGTTVASLTAKNTPTKIWAKNAKTVDEINKHHRNEKYLPGAKLTESLVATHSLLLYIPITLSMASKILSKPRKCILDYGGMGSSVI